MQAASAPQAADAIPIDAARGALETLLGHRAFAASPRRKRLLAYLVEQTLAGRAARLKAFDIAVAVLGRDERFDPQQDPIVRLEVRRLRRDLEHYYLTAGAADPIRIDIPKGGYVPVFAAIEPPTPPPPAVARPDRGPRRGWAKPAALALAGLAMLAALVATLAWRQDPAPVAQARGPSVVVMPFQGLDGGDGAALLATGLTNQLVTDLTGVDTLRVYAGAAPATAPEAALPVVDFRVEGSVQRDPATIRVAARLVDAATNEVLWSETVDRAADMGGVLAVQDELALGLAERLALPNGVIAVATERPAGSRPRTMFAFDCVQRAWLYRRKSDARDRAEVMACLDQTVAREPDYANAWAMKSFLHMDGGRLGLVAPEDVAEEFAASQTAAERAFELEPQNIPSLQALANVRYNDGAFAEAERLQRAAIALSPHNPESLVQLGWRLWARGRLDEGIALIEEAIERSWRSPTWYHQALALALYLRGDLERAYAEAVLGQGFCCGLGQAALAITAAASGRADEARAALARAVAQAPLLASDPQAFWRVFSIKQEVIDRLNVGLRAAGLAAPGERRNGPIYSSG